jgi:uncharacterized metal-binding protein
MMPNRSVHNTATIFVAISLPFVIKSYNIGMVNQIALSTGALAGVILSPDLDLSENKRFFGQRGIFGLFYFLWRVYWYPYGKLLHHRGVLSHFPIIGTSLRLLYVGWPFLLIWLYFGNIQLDLGPLKWVFFGLCVVDTVHALMDVVTTTIRRAF